MGKTTTSASWALKLSDSGFKTLVVSSDPAHSLVGRIFCMYVCVQALQARSPVWCNAYIPSVLIDGRAQLHMVLYNIFFCCE